MLQKIIITFCILLYSVVSLFLEINETHVFNPDWTPHVRIHEVWQLVTNSSLGVLCLWLLWKKKKVVLSAAISLIIMCSFLVAYSLKSTYGGSMKYLDGSENLVFGINFGLFSVSIIVALLLISIYLEHRKNIDA